MKIYVDDVSHEVSRKTVNAAKIVGLPSALLAYRDEHKVVLAPLGASGRTIVAEERQYYTCVLPQAERMVCAVSPCSSTSLPPPCDNSVNVLIDHVYCQAKGGKIALPLHSNELSFALMYREGENRVLAPVLSDGTVAVEMGKSYTKQTLVLLPRKQRPAKRERCDPKVEDCYRRFVEAFFSDHTIKGLPRDKMEQLSSFWRRLSDGQRIAPPSTLLQWYHDSFHARGVAATA